MTEHIRNGCHLGISCFTKSFRFEAVKNVLDWQGGEKIRQAQIRIKERSAIMVSLSYKDRRCQMFDFLVLYVDGHSCMVESEGLDKALYIPARKAEGGSPTGLETVVVTGVLEGGLSHV